MSSSWRIDVLTKDASQSIQAASASLGYTSIIAPKGPNEPTKIEKGNVQKVLDLFGYPSASYPGIQDVIDFIQKSDVYVTAPTSGTDELYGGVLVRTGGTEALTYGQTANDDTFDFEAVEITYTVDTGDGVETSFSATLPEFADYNHQSLVIKVDGTELTSYAITDAEPEVITATELTSGSYTRATGALALVFSSAVADGSVITAEFTTDVSSDTYVAILDKYPQDSDRKVMVESTGSGNFLMYTYQVDNDGNYNEMADSPYEFSIVVNQKNGNGVNIYAPVVFEDNPYFSVLVNTNTFTTFTDDTSSVALYGGDRGTSPAESDTAGGYTSAYNDSTYPINIFFDTTALGSVATAFETLRGTYNKYARYLLPVVNQSAATSISDPSTAKNSVANDGIFYYCLSWGIHRDLYNDSNFLCSNMGLVAGKHADIINSGRVGVSPSWIDENGLGGQLGSSIVSFSYGASESELQQLQAASLNAVVMDYQYGPMIKASTTTQSYESDYRYIENVAVRDYIIKTVTEQILPGVINKPNDDFRRESVRSQCELVMSNVDEFLYDYVVKCDRENNTDDALNQKKFILTIGVQFTPVAKKILFTFINSRLGVDINEVVAKA